MEIDIMVTDMGKGFANGVNPDISQLLDNRQFGLAGMHERAGLIGAKLMIHSQSGVGTEINLLWTPEKKI